MWGHADLGESACNTDSAQSPAQCWLREEGTIDVRWDGHGEQAGAAETQRQQAVALSSAQLPPCASFSSDSASLAIRPTAMRLKQSCTDTACRAWALGTGQWADCAGCSVSLTTLSRLFVRACGTRAQLTRLRSLCCLHRLRAASDECSQHDHVLSVIATWLHSPALRGSLSCRRRQQRLNVGNTAAQSRLHAMSAAVGGVKDWESMTS